jgi:hypothetical protein
MSPFMEPREYDPVMPLCEKRIIVTSLLLERFQILYRGSNSDFQRGSEWNPVSSMAI